LLFDLLDNCPLLRRHIAEGKVGFGINHEMSDFRTGRRKNLDLVLCTPRGGGAGERGVTFDQLVPRYEIPLNEAQRKRLSEIPTLHTVPVGAVYLAVEAKAAMTAHIKALPRLFDELNSSHLAIHGSADAAIAAGFVMVNFAATFVSPGKNRVGEPTVVSAHRQPNDTVRTIEKIREIPRRSHAGAEGFDAIGVVVIEMANDGRSVKVVEGEPAPQPGDVLYYAQMIDRLSALYSTKFAHV